MTPETLPQAEVARVRRYCAERLSDRDRQLLRIECEISHQYLTIVEFRAPWDPASGADWVRNPIARLEYNEESETWQLYYRDRIGRFHEYPKLVPASSVEPLLAEVDRNPGRVFWR